MTGPVRSYLPWLRQGIAAALPARGADTPKVWAPLPVRLWLNDDQQKQPDQAIPAPVRLLGPGDVTGLDPAQVVRTDPVHQATGVTPNYFPIVEFARPDLPWLFTPFGPDGADRLPPWLVLVTVPADVAAPRVRDGAGAVSLTVPVRELPDLAESWAWAHTQVVRSDATVPLADAVEEALTVVPDRVVSRLVSPRLLHSGTRYHACLVPAFEAGRLAGLGLPVPADPATPAGPAWHAGNPDALAELPVFYTFEFSTGDAGDFEDTARRLRAATMPAGGGVARLDVTAPGWGVTGPAAGTAGAVAEFATALTPVGVTPAPWDQTARNALAAGLGSALTPSGAGAQVRPPVYGAAVARVAGPAADAPRWLRELNLDPRARVAAGLGAHAVRLLQEDLVAEAWRQLPAEQDVSAWQRRTVAATVRSALADRHLAAVPALRMAGRAVRVPRLAPSLLATRPLAVPDDPAGDEASPRFVPRLGRPLGTDLREVASEFLLPGLDAAPVEGVLLLRPDPMFVESFLIGANTEFASELRWRGYPADPRGTFLTQFWQDGDGAPAEMRDMSTWKPDDPLGSHLSGAAAAGLVLLVRGELLHRFPLTTISLVEGTWVAGRRQPTTHRVEPTFRCRWGADGVVLGFGIDADTAVGAATSAGRAGWFVVVEEPMTAPRFGLDAGGTPGSIPAHWSDLAQGQVAADEATLRGLRYVPLAGPLAGTRLDGLTWAADSAAMAAIVQQPPFRLVVHARRWLVPEEQPA